ncbi:MULTISPECIES: glycosyltransferase [unclassified Leeuwenhoekiella]|uniref:glycosyltransferase family 2 protein n=1 Tax=unclassified Leeuwenhoekiella TaxID=2615029 RepID=UPI000C5152D3|nr:MULTISPECIES: glycosyltransferase [unclassified Leeuwenhoekiella]MAW94134.1 hypothetical protein [Leeuwenhoekiella sp.]MBA82431.1 hypothetical protein [Leeuwenhoekiella sp.]|tara:strand:- start:35754 stop:36644 length:891 start_codon:yes stop_codon:yes gene_type:complete
MIAILIPVFNYPVRDLVLRIREMAKLAQVDYEILITDDASTNREILEQNAFLDQLDDCSYFKFENNIGRTASAQFLASKAQYENLLFLDADVLPANTNFLELFLENLEKASVVFGGISYPKEKPEPEKQLRFVYGHKRESRSLALRKKQPYRSITLAAVAIKKDLFFKVDMPQTNSYGLDIYFSYRLKQLKVDVLHIENPVVHLGIESNSEFLSKTREGLDTMYTLEKNRFVSKTYRPLQVIASRFEKLKMAKSFIRLFERVEFKALKNLNSANPSLAVFGAWRLYHYLKLRRDEA